MNTDAELPSPTTRDTWRALGPEEQWTLFSRVEMGAIGWERRVRQLKDELARLNAEFTAYKKRIEAEDERAARVENERREDSWKLTNSNRVLRKQIEELGQIPRA